MRSLGENRTIATFALSESRGGSSQVKLQPIRGIEGQDKKGNGEKGKRGDILESDSSVEEKEGEHSTRLGGTLWRSGEKGAEKKKAVFTVGRRGVGRGRLGGKKVGYGIG